MNTSPSPALIAWNAMRVVCSDEAQYRLTVVPGSVVEPSGDRDRRGHVEALLARRLGAAEHQVVDVGGVERGHLVERGPHDRRGEVVGSHAISEPLNARPIGLRAVATMTASGMGRAPQVVGYPSIQPRWRTGDAAAGTARSATRAWRPR